MDNGMGVVLVYTEDYIMPKKQFLLRGGISQDLEISPIPKIKENDFVLSGELDLSDFPDLSQPLPEVSLREQLRLTSVTRGKILSWQRGQQQHFLDMWHQAQSKKVTMESSVD